MSSSRKKSISQEEFISRCKTKQIAIRQSSFVDPLSEGICPFLTNQFIKYHMQKKSSNFFTSLRLVYNDDEISKTNLLNFGKELVHLSAAKSYLDIPNSVFYNNYSIYAETKAELINFIKNELLKLSDSQAIHITLGGVHSIALVKEVINKKNYYIIYDPNDDSEPAPLSDVNEVCNELFLVGDSINCAEKNYFHAIYSYIFDKKNIFNFNIIDFDLQKNISFLALIDQLRHINNDPNITGLLVAFDNKKMSLMTGISSALLLLKNEKSKSAYSSLINDLENAIVGVTRSSQFITESDDKKLQTTVYSNIPAIGNRTLLHEAAIWGDLDFISALHKRNVKDNLKLNSGRLAIHFAIEQGHYHLVDYMLRSNQYNLNELYEFKTQYYLIGTKHTDICKNTLLHFALYYDKFDIVKLLIEKFGADPNIDKLSNGYFPIIPTIELAREIEIKKYLLDQQYHPIKAVVLSLGRRELSLKDLFLSKGLTKITIDSLFLSLDEIKILPNLLQANPNIKYIDISRCQNYPTHPDYIELLEIISKLLKTNSTLLEFKVHASFVLHEEALANLNRNKDRRFPVQKQNFKYDMTSSVSFFPNSYSGESAKTDAVQSKLKTFTQS